MNKEHEDMDRRSAACLKFPLPCGMWFDTHGNARHIGGRLFMPTEDRDDAQVLIEDIRRRGVATVAAFNVALIHEIGERISPFTTLLLTPEQITRAYLATVE